MEEEKKQYFVKLLNENQKSNGDCIEWTGKSSFQGYGQHYAFKQNWIIHRVSYLVKNGFIPDGLYICHRCNNKKCINPEHLYAGTPKENTRDYLNDPNYPLMLKKAVETRKKNKEDREKEWDFKYPQKFLTVEETAKIFYVHPNTIYHALKMGYIKAIRLSNGPRSPYRISAKSLDDIHDKIIELHSVMSRKSSSYVSPDPE